MQSCFFVGQDPDYQLYAPTVLDEVLLNRKKTPENMQKAKQLLEQLDLSAFSERHPASLWADKSSAFFLRLRSCGSDQF